MLKKERNISISKVMKGKKCMPKSMKKRKQKENKEINIAHTFK
jgi:hypothetical protein